MGKSNDTNNTLASLIKYEGNDTIVWKHPTEDFNTGTQLIVHESQEAIFFRDGQALDSFPAGRHTLDTQKLPLLGKLMELPTGEGTFHSEVYFINMATQMGIKWGTDSKVRLFDPESGLHIELGASGEFNLRVADARKLLIKLVGTSKRLDSTDIIGSVDTAYFKAMIMTTVKSHLAQTIKEKQISILEIDANLAIISSDLKDKINAALEEYGLSIPEFYVTTVITPDDDPNFMRLKEQYAQKTLLVREEQIKKAEAEAAAERKIVEAETAARLKVVEAQGNAEAYRLQAEAEAAEMKMKGYTYAQETARQVGLGAVENGMGVGGGEGGNGGIGDIVGLGVGLGAMSGVLNMTKDALNPVMSAASGMGQGMSDTINAAQGGWSCVCGKSGVTGNFCPDCGAAKPAPQEAWDCACGQKGIEGNFCSNCGGKRPEKWDCVCGQKGIAGNFCSNCGNKRPAAWNCQCGRQGITGNFCDNCGSKKEGNE